jgi:hypothetical protein
MTIRQAGNPDAEHPSPTLGSPVVRVWFQGSVGRPLGARLRQICGRGMGGP